MARRSIEEWNKLIVGAARSQVSVSKYCEQHGLSKNLFYRMTQTLGYTSGGQRTEKWEAAARGEETQVENSRTFVAVPAETVEKAIQQPPARAFPASPVSIRCGKYLVIVGDGFSEDVLRRVLGVVANA